MAGGTVFDRHKSTSRSACAAHFSAAFYTVFQTKPQLAQMMLEGALESGVPFGWVTRDEVYGSDRNLWLLWAWQEKGTRQVRADRLAAQVGESGWTRCSAGDGARSPGLRLGHRGNTASGGTGQGLLAAGPP